MSFSDYLEDATLNYFFRNNPDSVVATATPYVGLLTAAPAESAATGAVAEVSGTNYARKSVTFSAPTTDSANRQVVNSGAVTFDEAGGSWGTITHVALFDAATGGNWLSATVLTDSGGSTTSKIITSGDVFKINIGDLKVKLD
jgi:hypothetical protein